MAGFEVPPLWLVLSGPKGIDNKATNKEILKNIE
jgi:hypothetical protein